MDAPRPRSAKGREPEGRVESKALISWKDQGICQKQRPTTSQYFLQSKKCARRSAPGEPQKGHAVAILEPSLDQNWNLCAVVHALVQNRRAKAVAKEPADFAAVNTSAHDTEAKRWGGTRECLEQNKCNLCAKQ